MSNDYYKTLGIKQEKESLDREKLREAYERSHDIRKFEIDMYWRRSSYLWAIQAATFGGLALILNTADWAVPNCTIFDLDYAKNCLLPTGKAIVFGSIWLFGTFTAIVWLFLLKGAKFWQNNWERHVDHLEDHFSGSLYKTYLVKNNTPPFSVSKLNELIACVAIIIWVLMAITFVGFTTSWLDSPIVVVPLIFVVSFSLWYFEPSLRMSGFGNKVGEAESKDGTKFIIISRPSLKERNE